MEASSQIRHELVTLCRVMQDVPDAALMREFRIGLDEYRIVANVERGFERTAADLSRRLDVSPSRMSLLIGRLKAKGLIEDFGCVGKKKVLGTTSAGSSAFRSCKRVVQRAYDRLLSPLSSDEREAFDIGTLSTALSGGGVMDASRIPDRSFLYIRSYSLSELNFTESARSAGLTFRELNALLALLQEECMTQLRMSSELLLPKSTVCELVRDMRDKKLVVVGAGRREVRLRATDLGTACATAASARALGVFRSDVRDVSDIETARFGDLAVKIVKAAREHD